MSPRPHIATSFRFVGAANGAAGCFGMQIGSIDRHASARSTDGAAAWPTRRRGHREAGKPIYGGDRHEDRGSTLHEVWLARSKPALGIARSCCRGRRLASGLGVPDVRLAGGRSRRGCGQRRHHPGRPAGDIGRPRTWAVPRLGASGSAVSIPRRRSLPAALSSERRRRFCPRVSTTGYGVGDPAREISWESASRANGSTKRKSEPPPCRGRAHVVPPIASARRSPVGWPASRGPP